MFLEFANFPWISFQLVSGLQLYYKETSIQVFPCEVCEIFINTYFHRTTQFFFFLCGHQAPPPPHRWKCHGIKNNSEQLSWLLLEVRLLTKTAFTLIQDTKYVYHKYIVFLKLAFNTLMHSVPKWSGTLSAVFCTFCSIKNSAVFTVRFFKLMEIRNI